MLHNFFADQFIAKAYMHVLHGQVEKLVQMFTFDPVVLYVGDKGMSSTTSNVQQVKVPFFLQHHQCLLGTIFEHTLGQSCALVMV